MFSGTVVDRAGPKNRELIKIMSTVSFSSYTGSNKLYCMKKKHFFIKPLDGHRALWITVNRPTMPFPLFQSWHPGDSSILNKKNLNSSLIVNVEFLSFIDLFPAINTIGMLCSNSIWTGGGPALKNKEKNYQFNSYLKIRRINPHHRRESGHDFWRFAGGGKAFYFIFIYKDFLSCF